MADQAEVFGQILTALENTLTNFNTTLSQQGISTLVPQYDGRTTKCREWLAAVEKYGEIHRFTDEKKINTAFLTARSSAEDFIRRWRVGTPAVQQTWTNLSAALVNHFGAVVDSNHALDLLRKIRQGPHENVCLYGERLFLLSQDAYSTAEMADPTSYALAQRQLVSYFTDGLHDRAIKLRIMRLAPNDLNGALTIARDEMNLMKRFELRNGHSYRRPSDSGQSIEPMEVNQVRTRTCHLCGKAGHMARDCSQRQPRDVQCLICGSNQHPTERCGRKNHDRRHVNSVDKQQPNGCFICGSLDHWKRDCPKNFRSTRYHGSHPSVRHDRNIGPNFDHRGVRNAGHRPNQGNGRGIRQ